MTCGPFQVNASLLGATPIDVLETVVSPVVPPLLNVLVPNSGPIAGGTPVTVCGKFFDTVSDIKFDGVSIGAGSVTTINDFHIISLTTPAHLGSAGPVTVEVITNRGIVLLERGFRYTYDEPHITSVAASTGPHAGGTALTISGTGFTLATEVLFNGVHATSLVVVSAISITCVTPAFIGTPLVSNSVNVTVRNPEFTSDRNGSGIGAFVYAFATPNITGVSPSNGNVLGGYDVTITGTGFTGARFVTFDGVQCTFHVVSDTTIVCQPPSSTVTTAVNVLVSNDGHNSGTSGNGLWTYTYPTPFITFMFTGSFSPSSGPAAGGTTVFIRGSNFFGVNAVTLGGVAATSLIVLSDRELKCVTGAHAVGVVNVVASTPTTNSGTSGNGKFTYT